MLYKLIKIIRICRQYCCKFFAFWNRCSHIYWNECARCALSLALVRCRPPNDRRILGFLPAQVRFLSLFVRLIMWKPNRKWNFNINANSNVHFSRRYHMLESVYSYSCAVAWCAHEQEHKHHGKGFYMCATHFQCIIISILFYVLLLLLFSLARALSSFRRLVWFQRKHTKKTKPWNKNIIYHYRTHFRLVLFGLLTFVYLGAVGWFGCLVGSVAAASDFQL